LNEEGSSYISIAGVGSIKVCWWLSNGL